MRFGDILSESCLERYNLSWKPLIIEYLLQKTFNYSSPLWSDKNVYNLAGGKTGFDDQETKLPSYRKTHFSKICLGMRSGLTTRFVVIDRSAKSLYALIADGRYRALSLGRNKWKSLIGPQASLQRNCNKERCGWKPHSIKSNDRHHCEPTKPLCNLWLQNRIWNWRFTWRLKHVWKPGYPFAW